MSAKIWMLLFIAICVVFSADAAPDGFFKLLYPNYNTQRRSHSSGGRTGGPRASGGRSYKEICKVHNFDPYAGVGRSPYPSGPLCPY